MPLTIRDVVVYIIEKIHLPMLEQIWDYVKDHEPVLWGEEQPEDFLKIAFILSLYKDKKRIGYQKLLKKVVC
jgi:hypothetical protein